MKKLIHFALLAFAAIVITSTTAFAISTTHVRGHYRKNGTYVKAHRRTKANHNFHNNWSTRGNTNPHTGNHRRKHY